MIPTVLSDLVIFSDVDEPNMNHKVYNDAIAKLRSPERVELLEVDRVVDICLSGNSIESLLDIGTGSGLFAEAFIKKKIDVTGIDLNFDMLLATKHFAPKIKLVRAILEILPFADAKFDVSFLGHVLHESEDQLAALKEVKRITKKDVFIFEWPYTESTKGPPLNHRISPSEIINLAEQAEFTYFEEYKLDYMVLFKFN